MPVKSSVPYTANKNPAAYHEQSTLFPKQLDMHVYSSKWAETRGARTFRPPCLGHTCFTHWGQQCQFKCARGRRPPCEVNNAQLLSFLSVMTREKAASCILKQRQSGETGGLDSCQTLLQIEIGTQSSQMAASSRNLNCIITRGE